MKKCVKSADLIQLALQLRRDEGMRAAVRSNPLAYLESIGLTVEDCFKEAVAQQLAQLTRGVAAAIAIAPPEGSFVFTTNVWGLVLVINGEGLGWLHDAPLDRVSAAIGEALALQAAADTDPLLATLVMIAPLWCAIQADWLLADASRWAMPASGHHQGLYLTWTWLGLAATAYLPVSTAMA